MPLPARPWQCPLPWRTVDSSTKPRLCSCGEKLHNKGDCAPLVVDTKNAGPGSSSMTHSGRAEAAKIRRRNLAGYHDRYEESSSFHALLRSQVT